MIHDKDYIIRIVKQFSEALNRLILEKNEGKIEDDQRIFDTQMNDVFKMDFDQFSALSTDEIIEIVEQKDTHHHVPYLELLGHLFFAKGTLDNNPSFFDKSKFFYEKYLQKSGVFSLPIINRISEINSKI
ncbi:hypothetical protein [Amniculibacterium sp. G2-70]|uniref:hypothetical protein n=1 Tax=Amniculibacterium sp. G2-70 TaxID=2767188 RepID=UPI0016541D97|nr:hypothetical protein [Amniculibacterium sp. G2-70]